MNSTLQAVADDVVAAVGGHARALVLIDGRSGAGKSTLSEHLAGRLGAQVVPLDGLYPGWDGLAEGTTLALERVIRPFAAGEIGRWHRYDWLESRFSDVVETVDPTRPLIVEGCGVTTPEAASLADVVVWLDGDPGLRRERALERDGDTFRPHWDRWARQEDEHIRLHDPASVSTIVAEIPAT